MSLGELIPDEFQGAGLTAAELAIAQEEAEAAFPLDLCELLTDTLPSGPKFPDWRGHARQAMQAWRNRLVDDFHFDVMNNAFWLEAWGPRPDDPNESRAVVVERLAQAPDLIPIYAHRGIPNEPLEPGNPVFSVWQTDIIVYGADLADYLVREFHESTPRSDALPRPIRFWTEMLNV